MPFVRENTRNHDESRIKRLERQGVKNSTINKAVSDVGNLHISKEKCPARNTKCKKCSKVVHWVVACRSKMLSEIHDEIVIEDADCVFYGEGVSQDNALWKIELKLDGENVQFKMDTRKTFLS